MDMSTGRDTCLVEELVIVREHALDQLEREHLVEVLKLEELRTLVVPEQTEVLDGERVAGGGAERSRRAVQKGNRFEFAGEQYSAIFFDEHDRLAQRRGCGGRHDCGPRLVQLET